MRNALPGRKFLPPREGRLLVIKVTFDQLNDLMTWNHLVRVGIEIHASNSSTDLNVGVATDTL